MQGATGGKAMEGFQTVAIQDGGMVIARLHHHEEVQGIGVMEGVIRQGCWVHQGQIAGANALQSPVRRLGGRGEHQIHEGLGLGLG